MYLYFHNNSWTEPCQWRTSMSITKTAANPQEELPILSTKEGSWDGSNEPFVDDDDTQEELDEDVLIAIISPKRIIGRTKPELVHFDS